MNIKQWVILIILLIILLALIIPRQRFIEFFNDDLITNAYKTVDTESEYYNKIYNPMASLQSDKLLILDRCIKVPYDATMLDQFITNAKFPIISKQLLIDNYNDIDQHILTILKDFYLQYNIKSLHGPVYVLLGQAPLVKAINDDCTIRTINVQYTFNDNINILPKIITGSNSEACPSQSTYLTAQKLAIHIHVLFPTYNLTGDFIYRAWDNVKCNMKDLLSQRSKDQNCFIQCFGSANKICGCLNQEDPYTSICYGDGNTNLETTRINYFNLYIINELYVNRYFNANLNTLFFGDRVSIQPFDTTNLDYCATNVPILDLNNIPFTTLSSNVAMPSPLTYRIKSLLTNTCLDELSSTPSEKIDTCTTNSVKQEWILEPSTEDTIKIKSSLSGRYLNAYYNATNRSITVNTITASVLTTPKRWRYVDNRIIMVDRILNSYLRNENQYLHIENGKLTIVNEDRLLVDTQQITLRECDFTKYQSIFIINPLSMQVLSTNLTNVVFANNIKAWHQQWIFEKVTLTNYPIPADITCKGIYKIKNKSTGDYLTARFPKSGGYYSFPSYPPPTTYSVNSIIITMVPNTASDISLWLITDDAIQLATPLRIIGLAPDSQPYLIFTNRFVLSNTKMNWMFGSYNSLVRSWQIEPTIPLSTVRNDYDQHVDNTLLRQSLIS